MTMILAGGASTQSRGRRPLPLGVVRDTTMTISSYGVIETVHFDFEDGHHERRKLLSWVGGQSGLLFGSPEWKNLPPDIWAAIDGNITTHGSYGHAAEYALADALGEVFDGYLTSSNMACRFFQSGGEACSAAVRIARAVTGHDAIATQGYHGAATDFAHEPAWTGYPRFNRDLHRRFDFGDVKTMQECAGGYVDDGQAASCIMVEVPAWDDEAAISASLHECRKTADEHDIPLIIDDVVCGMRLGLRGSISRYGVKPDLLVLGKALSATGCISAVVGRSDLVNMLSDQVFFSTTFGGSPGPCSVAAATVRWLMAHESEVFGESGHLQIIGRALKDGFNSLGIRVIGQPERSVFQFATDDEWLRFCSLMIAENVMVHRPNFVSLVHNMDHVKQTLDAAEKVLTLMKVS